MGLFSAKKPSQRQEGEKFLINKKPLVAKDGTGIFENKRFTLTITKEVGQTEAMGTLFDRKEHRICAFNPETIGKEGLRVFKRVRLEKG